MKAIRANLFPNSHAAICDWERFPWHRDKKGEIQTHKLESSQALAIDVFGTIKVSDERDRILSSLAMRCGLPAAGPWSLELEWNDPDRLLNEPRATQVDALAVGLNAVLIIECKFKEAGGGCSQPNPIRKGQHRGLHQCNGNYELQTNPVNGRMGRCALTAKGIGYWDAIPILYGLNSKLDYRPCPFRGEAYQWMRNVVLAHRLALTRGVSSAVIAAYADADGFPTAEKVRSGNMRAHWGPVTPMSYQSIVALAGSISARPHEWNALARWIGRKIEAVALKQR